MSAHTATFTENWFDQVSQDRLAELGRLVDNVPGVIVEIGSWEGRSTCVLANAIRPREVIAIDTWQGSPGEISHDLAAEREYGSGPPPPNAQTCGRPAHCPPGFCDPYRTVKLAEYYRAKNGPLLMLGIAAAVDSKVVPFWRDYLNGGSPPRNITAGFAADFTASPSTARTSAFVRRSLELAVPARLAGVPMGQSQVVSLPTFLPAVASAIDDPFGLQQMNFNIPRDIPGNLAGGIGKDQKACPSGAQPSPFDDERRLRGTATVTRIAASRLRVTPDIQYTDSTEQPATTPPSTTTPPTTSRPSTSNATLRKSPPSWIVATSRR